MYLAIYRAKGILLGERLYHQRYVNLPASTREDPDSRNFGVLFLRLYSVLVDEIGHGCFVARPSQFIAHNASISHYSSGQTFIHDAVLLMKRGTICRMA
jgi:hypothetical protein